MVQGLSLPRACIQPHRRLHLISNIHKAEREVSEFFTFFFPAKVKDEKAFVPLVVERAGILVSSTVTCYLPNLRPQLTKTHGHPFPSTSAPPGAASTCTKVSESDLPKTLSSRPQSSGERSPGTPLVKSLRIHEHPCGVLSCLNLETMGRQFGV